MSESTSHVSDVTHINEVAANGAGEDGYYDDLFESNDEFEAIVVSEDIGGGQHLIPDLYRQLAIPFKTDNWPSKTT